jgi:hypothetical protein
MKINWNVILTSIITVLIASLITSTVWFFSVPYRIEAQAAELKTLKTNIEMFRKEDIEPLKQGREENKMKIVALETNQANILSILKEMQNDIKDLLRRKP